jgi:hypothetical protein
VIATLNRILRSPAAVAEACRDDAESPKLLRVSLATLTATALVFGAVVGMFHGGRQIAFAACKMPLVLLATLALSMPAFHALASVFGRTWSFRAIVTLSLVAGARFGLVLLALAPAVWLAIDVEVGYHAVKIGATLAYALSGLAGLSVFVRGLGAGAGKQAMLVSMIGVFAAVGAQNAWVMRPWLVEPEAQEAEFFVRKKEGGLVGQLTRSVKRVVTGHADEAKGAASP